MVSVNLLETGVNQMVTLRLKPRLRYNDRVSECWKRLETENYSEFNPLRSCEATSS